MSSSPSLCNDPDTPVQISSAQVIFLSNRFSFLDICDKIILFFEKEVQPC